MLLLGSVPSHGKALDNHTLKPCLPCVGCVDGGARSLVVTGSRARPHSSQLYVLTPFLGVPAHPHPSHSAQGSSQPLATIPFHTASQQDRTLLALPTACSHHNPALPRPWLHSSSLDTPNRQIHRWPPQIDVHIAAHCSGFSCSW